MAGESSEVNLQHIWLQSGIAEQAVPCCKPTSQMRKLRNKGAILVLVWNYLLVNVSHYLVVSIYKPAGTIVVTIRTVTLGITLPFAGWLADVYLGRYKVIYAGAYMWIMWVGSMLATLGFVVVQLIDSYYIIFKKISIVMFIIMAISFGG